MDEDDDTPVAWSSGSDRGLSFYKLKCADGKVKASISAPEGERAEMLSTWESADKWIDKEIANIITGGRYATK